MLHPLPSFPRSDVSVPKPGTIPPHAVRHARVEHGQSRRGTPESRRGHADVHTDEERSGDLPHRRERNVPAVDPAHGFHPTGIAARADERSLESEFAHHFRILAVATTEEYRRIDAESSQGRRDRGKMGLVQVRDFSGGGKRMEEAN